MGGSWIYSKACTYLYLFNVMLKIPTALSIFTTHWTEITEKHLMATIPEVGK